MKRILKTILATLCLSLTISLLSEGEMSPLPTASASAAVKKTKKSGTSKKSTGKGKKNTKTGKKTTGKGKKTVKSTKPATPTVSTIMSDPSTGEWMHRGAKGIIVHRDKEGKLRAMSPFSASYTAGRSYAAALNRYADELSREAVQIYSLIAPTQGEFYMPPIGSAMGSEERAINTTYNNMSRRIKTVSVCDTMRNHLDEEIYSRTDHHWAPLGAYYAAKAFAEAAGVPFLPLEAYSTDSVMDYVGTMVKFSGDNSIRSYPETFYYYKPAEGYSTEFITYTVSNGKTVGESEPHPEAFFRKFPDGSMAAYSTFMGGDTRTVKVWNTGGTPDRKLLIVKDSYGNAMAPCLFGSFEEVHVVDFRYYPHNLLDYVIDNDITDLLFVNCIELAFAGSTANRLNIMIDAEY